MSTQEAGRPFFSGSRHCSSVPPGFPSGNEACGRKPHVHGSAGFGLSPALPGSSPPSPHSPGNTPESTQLAQGLARSAGLHPHRRCKKEQLPSATAGAARRTEHERREEHLQPGRGHRSQAPPMPRARRVAWLSAWPSGPRSAPPALGQEGLRPRASRALRRAEGWGPRGRRACFFRSRTP